MTCPQCGARVTYVGLNGVECEGSSCENYKAPARSIVRLDGISYDVKPESTISFDEYPWF